MSRSGYSEDCYDTWAIIRWQGAVRSAIRGKRGQSFFKDLIAALDALPEKRLVSNELEAADGAVCALGALGRARGVAMAEIDPEDAATVAGTFGIADALAREVVYMNDEWSWRDTPEERWARMRKWAEKQLVALPTDGGEHE